MKVFNLYTYQNVYEKLWETVHTGRSKTIQINRKDCMNMLMDYSRLLKELEQTGVEFKESKEES